VLSRALCVLKFLSAPKKVDPNQKFIRKYKKMVSPEGYFWNEGPMKFRSCHKGLAGAVYKNINREYLSYISTLACPLK